MRDVTIALLIAGALAGCGKKGPPLQPIVRVPSATGALAARRVGSDIYVTFQVPSQNLDGSMPASVAEVEVYAVTARTPPPRTRFLEIATLVGRVPVAPAGDPAGGDAPVAGPDPALGVLQGAPATIRDTLARDELIPRELPDDDRPSTQAGATTTARVQLLRRFYMAVPFSDRRRPGPPSAIAEVPLAFVPEPPTGLDIALTETRATLTWQPSGGLLAWLLERTLPPESRPIILPPAPPTPAAQAAAEPPAGPTTYNVYRDVAPDPLALPVRTSVPAWHVDAPLPINPSPLAALTHPDPIVVDERERCYEVRALRGGVESAPTSRACATPVDVYPPAMPSALSALPSENAINLIWEANVEPDLGGYIVLRREAGSATLLTLADAPMLTLTDAPISDTRFTDRQVTPGVSYTYQVRAVDSRIPLPNMSPPAEVTETAR